MKKWLSFLPSLLLAGVFFMPTLTKAATATLESVSPSSIADISDQVAVSDIEDLLLLGYDYGDGVAMGTDYTLVYALTGTAFQLSNGPAIILGAGADITSWSYDATTQKLTINLKTASFAASVPEWDSVFIIGIEFPVENYDPSLPGIPAGMTGMSISTTVMGWSVAPPFEGYPYIGVTLSGAENTSVFFHMYIPESTIDYLSELAGKELTVNDLAVFVDSYQASMNISEINNGAYIDIDITFTTGNTQTAQARYATDDIVYIDKYIETGEQAPLSLAATKTSISQGARTRLYGWLSSGRKNKTITIYRKLQGEKKYKLFKEAVTEEGGYFKLKLRLQKTAKYKAIFKSRTSSIITITVN